MKVSLSSFEHYLVKVHLDVIYCSEADKFTVIKPPKHRKYFFYRLPINYFTDFREDYIPITISGLILLSLLTKWTIFTPESACPPAPSSMSKSIPSQPYLEFIYQT